ncbi:MAG: mevalonate kinase [Candidatus Heimdallarchaeota archaeon]|nr:mevalonate kinase [Candidatus Heimdallarchaeota archaeon]
MKIISTAPGKLILFGEHASSRGKPSIVFAVNRRMDATLTQMELSEKKIVLSSNEMNVTKVEYPTEKLDLVSKTIEIFLQETGSPIESFEIDYNSKIPAGFGSSAAVIATTLGVLDSFYNTKLKKYSLLKMGLKINQSIKGYGSGLDIAASIYGGILLYQSGKEPKYLTNGNLNLVIGNTGIKVKSDPIVKSVRIFEKKNPVEARRIFDEIEDLVIKAELALINSDYKKLGAYMNQNQQLLQELGVSSPILEKMINISIENGAFGAKLSGAGIGDNMIALVSEDVRETIIQAINLSEGFVLQDIKIDMNGLIIKKYD